jgi:hypothetical protein
MADAQAVIDEVPHEQDRRDVAERVPDKRPRAFAAVNVTRT